MNLYFPPVMFNFKIIFESASFILALLFIVTPLNLVFAQETISEVSSPESLEINSVGTEIVQETLVEPVTNDLESVAVEYQNGSLTKEQQAQLRVLNNQLRNGEITKVEYNESVNKILSKQLIEDSYVRSTEGIDTELQTLGKYLSPQVSASDGSLEYKYPFTVPPGTDDLTPNHSLIYNSNNKNQNSIFGVGWSIDIPYIQRHNINGTDKLYDEDRFISSLDGELVYQGGGVYKPRVENGSFIKYEYVNSIWKITDKLGKVYIFGNSNNSRQSNPENSSQVYSWFLDLVTDANGNSILYHYFHDRGQIYPDYIKYGKNELFSIKFIKASSTKSQAETFRSAFGISNYYEITGVNVYFNNELSKEYNFEYSNRSIKSITATGYMGPSIQQSSEITYEYSSEDNTWVRDDNAILPHYTSGSTEYPVPISSKTALADANGDGLIDFIRPQNFGVFNPPIPSGSATGSPLRKV